MPLSSQLEHKLEQSKMVIEEALLSYPAESCLIAWSAGKDSTLVLKLTIEVCQALNLPVPRVIDIDQHDQFDELMDFRTRLVEQWDLDLIVVKNADFLDKTSQFNDTLRVADLDDTNRSALADIDYTETTLDWVPDTPICNHLLKTLPINEFIVAQNIQALFTGIRWDEHGARAEETYFSSREKPQHTRIHPILHLSERDIWDINFALDIPFNDLYQQGYRTLGSKTGTEKLSDIPAWEQDLESTSERSGRNQDKEKMMEQLRAWGYM